MTRWGLTFVVLTVSGCCCDCGGPKQESYVSDVPATLEKAKAMASPPKTTVSVEVQTKDKGGACHSGACFLVLPFILYDALTPEQYNRVTVREGDREVFTGTYTTDGALLSGTRQLGDGKAKEVLAMHLETLNRQVVVESARIENGVRTPTPLQPQHDFLGDYRKALEHETHEDKRGAMLREQLQWLGAEAVPALSEALKDPKEPDRSKAAVLKTLCDAHAVEPSKHEAALVAAAGDALGPLSALAELPCFPDGERNGLLLDRVVGGFCDEKNPTRLRELDQALVTEMYAHADHKPRMSEAAKRCTHADRRAAVALLFKEPAERQGVAELLEGTTFSDLPRTLDFADPAQRGGYFDALASGHNADRLLGQLTLMPRPLTPEELAQLARGYTQGHLFFERDPMRAEILKELQSCAKGVDAKPAQAALETARASAKGDDAAVIDTALLVLGDFSRGPAVMKASSPFDGTHPAVSTPGALMRYGLELSGCTEPELRERKHCTAWGR
jgi:hypothetical protein